MNFVKYNWKIYHTRKHANYTSVVFNTNYCIAIHCHEILLIQQIPVDLIKKIFSFSIRAVVHGQPASRVCVCVCVGGGGGGFAKKPLKILPKP